MLMPCWIVLLGVFLSQSRTTCAKQNSCRNDRRRENHLPGLWNDGFPNDENRYATCDGSIAIVNDEICVTGRVNYYQLRDFLENMAMFVPAAPSISLNGHLIAGSGNVVLGGQTRYLYDFVRSYTVNGVSYTADPDTIVDHLLAASFGTIDAVCLSMDIQREEEEWYQISHKVEVFLNNLDIGLLRTNEEIGLLFFSNVNAVVEFHRENVAPPNGLVRSFHSSIMTFVTQVVYALPTGGLSTVIPLFAITGISRLLLAGRYSTKEHPNPLTAPDALFGTVGVQVDTPWDTMMDAIENFGLFVDGESRVPLFMNVVIKRAIAVGTNFACWGTGTIMAVIDIEAPPGQTEQMDAYIRDVVFPKLRAANPTQEVGLHVGKRSPPDSDILRSALRLYKSCGAQVALVGEEACFHPLCERTDTPTSFSYPEAYTAER